MSKSARYLVAKKTETRIWGRGETYFNNDRVEVVECEAKSVRAIVYGTEPYYVKLELAGGGIRQSCTCPYYADQGYICKHIVAVAIEWDDIRGIEVPDDLPQDLVIEDKPSRGRQWIEEMYANPLTCKLDDLRKLPDATALGGKGRPHSDLPDRPKDLVLDPDTPVTLQEIRRCISEMRRWGRRRTFDPYFCSGEVVAAFCELVRAFRSRLQSTDVMVAVEGLVLVQEYQCYIFQQMIDDSLGVHEISVPHVEDLYHAIRKHKSGVTDFSRFSALLRDFHHKLESMW